MATNCIQCSRTMIGFDSKTCQTCSVFIDREKSCTECGEILLMSERKWCGRCAKKVAKKLLYKMK